MISEEEWPSWVEEQCAKNGWTHSSSSSPLIWRELIDRGGKGYYLGGTFQFEEYINQHYSIKAETTQDIENKIATENLDVFQTLQLEAIKSKPPEPLRVCISHASSPITYQLAPLLLTQKVFKEEKIHIVLFDHKDHIDSLNALSLELQDMSVFNLAGVQVTDSATEAFRAVSVAFLLNYTDNYTEGNEEQLLEAAQTYTTYAGIIDFSSEKSIKVILTGSYANVGATIMSTSVASIDARQFIASPSLAEYQASSIIASKLNVSSADIEQMGIWGPSEGPNVIPDTSHVLVHHYQGSIVGNDEFTLPLEQCLFEKHWIKEEFPVLLATRQKSGRSTLVEAAGLAKLMKSWWSGDGVWHSVGVVFDSGVAICRPCCCKGNGWERIEGVEVNEYIREPVEREKEKLQAELAKFKSS